MRRVSLPATALVVGFACQSQPPAVSELVVAVQSDVALPDSVDHIRVEVSTEGSLRFGNDYDVGPSALRIPATLGLLAGSNPSSPVTVRIIASKGAQTKMLREVTT